MRFHQMLLIGSTLLGSWLGMQAIHEMGHVLGALLTDGQVAQVVLNPLTISRTDLAENPQPRFVVWAGPVVGSAMPLALWGLAMVARQAWAFVVRFFAGFCLLANGLYIGVGSFDHIGDAGEMLRHGAEPWQLWLFGVLTAPLGLWLWHGQGPHFGFGVAKGSVHRGIAYGSLGVCMGLLVIGFAIGGE